MLADLRDAGLVGVCSEQWYTHGLPNARNRVVELEREHHHIVSVRCADDHGLTGYARYVLLHGPERTCAKCPWMPAQQSLALEVA